MIYLLLSIICSVGIVLVFKFFAQFKIDIFQAVVWNYLICVIVGAIFQNDFPFKIQNFQSIWFPFALALGLLFILVFVIIGITTQKMGITITTITTRMSVVIPVSFAIFYYNENVNTLKFIGIFIAIIAVVLTTLKEKDQAQNQKNSYWILPLLLFLGSGMVDTSLQYIEESVLQPNGLNLFLIYLFLSAFFFGFLLLIINLFRGKINLQGRNLIGGIALGIPNYFTAYFIFKTLESDILEKSILFPINNVGIVLLATFLAFLFFKERLSKINLFGIFLAILAIFLMSGLLNS